MTEGQERAKKKAMEFKLVPEAVKAAGRGRPAECLDWLSPLDIWPERWGAQEKAFVAPQLSPDWLSDGCLEMAEQARAREAEEQEAPLDQFDQNQPPEAVTMPEAVEDLERSPLDLPPAISTADIPEAVDQVPATPAGTDHGATPWVEDAPEDPKHPAPADAPRPAAPRQQPKGTFPVTAAKQGKKGKKPKPGRVPIEGGFFVPLSFDEQDSIAYVSLGGNAAKLYGYLKRAARTAASNGGGVRERDIVFDYTYAEAKRRSFSESTFIRAIKELWARGFIEVVQIGGLRGMGRTNSQYKLAAYWKTYGSEWTDRTRSQTDPFAKTSEPKNGRDAKW